MRQGVHGNSAGHQTAQAWKAARIIRDLTNLIDLCKTATIRYRTHHTQICLQQAELVDTTQGKVLLVASCRQHSAMLILLQRPQHEQAPSTVQMCLLHEHIQSLCRAAPNRAAPNHSTC